MIRDPLIDGWTVWSTAWMIDSSVAAGFNQRAIWPRYCMKFRASSCCCCFSPYSWNQREAISSSLLNSPRSRFLNESHVVVHVLFLDYHVAVSLRRRREAMRVFIRSSKDRGNVASQSSMNVSRFPWAHRKTLVGWVPIPIVVRLGSPCSFFQLWRTGST
jgi:hypothetical protein